MVPGFLTDWLKSLIGARQRQKATDMRIGDEARQLRRTLAASFEGWGPIEPKTQADLTSWAVKFASGFDVTEPAMRALMELRPEASGHVQRAVKEADRHYYAAADKTNPLITNAGLTVDDRNRETVLRSIQEAVQEVRECLAVLDTITTK